MTSGKSPVLRAAAQMSSDSRRRHHAILMQWHRDITHCGMMTIPPRSWTASLITSLAFAIAVSAAEQPGTSAKTGTTPTFAITSKVVGTVKVTEEDGATVFTIQGGNGIGDATIRRHAAQWPAKLIVRARLGGLEHFAITSGGVKLAASVLSHSGNMQLLHLWTDGKEGPQLGKDSEYWMEIRTLGADGKSVNGLPPKGGCFEMTIPTALLGDAKEVRLDWIDFYR